MDHTIRESELSDMLCQKIRDESSGVSYNNARAYPVVVWNTLFLIFDDPNDVTIGIPSLGGVAYKVPKSRVPSFGVLVIQTKRGWVKRQRDSSRHARHARHLDALAVEMQALITTLPTGRARAALAHLVTNLEVQDSEQGFYVAVTNLEGV